MAAAGHGGTAGKSPRGAAAALAMAMGLAALATSIANIALPALAQDFAAPVARVQGVVVAYLAAMTVVVLGAGRLGDRFGLRPMLELGLALFAAGSAFAALAPGLGALMAARAVQGTGAAFLTVLALALLRQTAEAARIGRAMGLAGSVTAAGTALGPALGGALIPLAGWRGIFWLLVPLALLTLVLVRATLPAGRAGRAPEPAARLAPDPGSWGGLAPGLAANLLVAAVMMTTLVIGPFYLGPGLGLGSAAVGLVMAAGPGIAILAGVPAGRLADRWGHRRAGVLGAGLVMTGALLLAAAPSQPGAAAYVAALAVLTPGYQLFLAANTAALMAGVSAARRGTVSGAVTLSRNLGLTAGAAGMGGLFARLAGEAASPAAIGAATRQSFLAAAALALLALLAIQAAPPRR